MLDLQYVDKIILDPSHLTGYTRVLKAIKVFKEALDLRYIEKFVLDCYPLTGYDRVHKAYKESKATMGQQYVHELVLDALLSRLTILGSSRHARERWTDSMLIYWY